MKIKNLSITDFRGIVGTLELDFTGLDGKPNNVIVLAGPNGCGKTSVLEACVYFHNDFNKLSENKSVVRRTSPTNISVAKDSSILQITHVINNDSFNNTITLKREVDSGAFTIGKRIKDNVVLTLNTEKPIRDLDLPNIPIVYFSSWRGPKLPEGVVLYANSDEQAKAVTEENRLYHIINNIVREQAKRSFNNAETPKPDKADEMIGKINKGWKFFYPECKNDYFEAKTYGEDKFNIFLNKTDYNELLPVDALSSGELEVFIMLGWFAVNDFAESVILIDEPELHLHPKWQKIIVPALREMLPDTQFIVATHSPFVIGSVKPYEIKLLEHTDRVKRGQAESATAPSPDASYGLEANRILEDIMGISARTVDEVDEEIKKLFLEIDKDNLESAKNIVQKLRETISSDPELVKAETLIRLKETIGK